MSERMYLLDNNVVGFIGPKRRASDFFRERCRVPQEVAYEAGPRRASELASITKAMTPAVLAQLAAVMRTVPVGHTKLVDLYGNKGAADPILVATALVLNNPRRPTLFDPKWAIATRDKEVAAKAREFSIGTVTPAELADVIDQSLA